MTPKRRIATISTLAAVAVLAATAHAVAASVRTAPVGDPNSYGEWIQDVERPTDSRRR
jgi:hypothetical protein